ncbi:MAG TPA: hypothetical protein VHC69_18785 [Polyangiaceae bacterium]|nr:hypothetical protein [Polyangiaceae bacterium]
MSGSNPFRVAGVLGLAYVLPACAGADLSSPGVEGPRVQGNVESARSALREDTCWTDAQPDATIRVGEAGSFETESKDGTYDHASCSHAWIVEATDTLDKRLLVGAGAAGLAAANQDWCEGFWSENEAMGCRGAPCTFVPLGSWSERAKWHARTSAAPGFCESVVTGAPPDLASDHGFSKLRIVTEAGWVYWYQGAYARITTP